MRFNIRKRTVAFRPLITQSLAFSLYYQIVVIYIS